MATLVHSANLSELSYSTPSCKEVRNLDRSMRKPDPVLAGFFKTIPPERIGLDGEYDHQGLAKRVVRLFHHRLELDLLDQFRVSQRGGVVILTGSVPSRPILNQLVELALSVSGANYVEVQGLHIKSERG
jgi:hypothetical protein